MLNTIEQNLQEDICALQERQEGLYVDDEEAILPRFYEKVLIKALSIWMDANRFLSDAKFLPCSDKQIEFMNQLDDVAEKASFSMKLLRDHIEKRDRKIKKAA